MFKLHQVDNVKKTCKGKKMVNWLLMEGLHFINSCPDLTFYRLKWAAGDGRGLLKFGEKSWAA
jgi:hypothetical protein